MAVVISITGADASVIVNNLTTNDIRKLPEGHSLEAFVTDVRGWVVAFVHVLRLQDEYLLVAQLPDASVLVRHIDRYIVREDAAVRDRSDELACFVSDPQSSGSQASPQLGQFPAAFHRRLGELIVTEWPTRILSPHSRLILVAQAESGQFVERLRHSGIYFSNEEMEFETKRIRAFWPVAGREIHDKTLPQELDRDASAISFTKGCYLGQETVARLDARGQLQKKLCLLAVSGMVESGTQLVCSEKQVGVITSIAHQKSGPRSFALAFMKRGFFEPGQQLELSSGTAIILDHQASFCT